MDASGVPSSKSGLLAGNFLSLSAIVLWASSFLVTDRLLASWDPVWLTVGRILGAGLALLLFCALGGRLGTLRPASWPRMIAASVVGFGLAGLAIVVGQKYSDPVTTAIIVTTGPLISALMGLAEGSERPSAHLWLGILLAVAGGVLASLEPGSWWPAPRGGEVLVLLSQIFWIWYSRISASGLGPLDAVAKSTLGLTTGGLFLLLVAAIGTAFGLVSFRIDTRSESLALLVWLAVFSIAVSVSLWLAGVRILGTTIASIHTNLAPFYVMLMSLALLGTAPRPGQVVGGALVAAGAVLAQWPAIRRKITAQPPIE
ncbi:MAG: DMT family transporter [Geminicoccaceae bacterium]|nr:DMT family transporter [Geminicoccaceae bacterium]MDW8342304.1 DMT family transporter [Geminicoccaceae bacterium]